MNTQTAITTAQAQAPVDPHKRIPARPVRELCGGVCDMTIRRWLDDPAKGFPKPHYIGRRRYWREAEIVAWLDAQ